MLGVLREVTMTDIAHAIHLRHAAGGETRRPQAELATDRVYVLFTSMDETLSAVRVAKRLAEALKSRLTVVHFRPIGFGDRLEAPTGLSPAETEEFKTRLEAEACEAEVRVCLCRDARRAIPAVLTEPSLVVVGRHRHWWPTPADHWQRTLEAAGQFVVVAGEDANA